MKKISLSEPFIEMILKKCSVKDKRKNLLIAPFVEMILKKGAILEKFNAWNFY